MKTFTLMIILVLMLGSVAKGDTSYIDYLSITDEVIVNAIYLAEGGAKTRYPYGIVSIDTKGDCEYARKLCFNTVRNNKKRFRNQSKYTDYIEFLGSRYCPVGAKNDPTGLNKNWVKNVKYFINK